MVDDDIEFKINEFLDNYKKEIEQIEYKIKNVDKTNKKIHIIRNVKKTWGTIKYAGPLVSVNCLLIYLFAVINRLPFYKDTREIELNVLKEIDSFGNIRYEEQYKEFTNPNNIISLYSKWYIDEDGTYYRKVETYNVRKMSEEEIMNILNSDISSIYDILLNPINTSIERSNNVSESELENGEFLCARIYSKEKNDYIIIEENNAENIAFTLLCILLMILSSYSCVIMKNLSNKNLKSIYEKIDQEYKFVNSDELNRKLEIKRNNYSRLVNEYEK